MNLSVSKFVIMIISSLYVGGIIFREEEIQKRTSYCAQILNLSVTIQLCISLETEAIEAHFDQNANGNNANEEWNRFCQSCFTRNTCYTSFPRWC